MAGSMERWIGKVAIVTGASSGIGYATALSLVDAGMKVVAVGRRKERLEKLRLDATGKKGELLPYPADVTKEMEILNLFKWVKANCGPVHVLINGAGVLRPTNLTEGSTQMWKEVLDTNVLAVCIATREAVQDMRANKVDGHIIHLNSILGHGVPNFSNFNIYYASKYAVTALTETLRQELNLFKDKIKISSISPGYVHTEMFRNENAYKATQEFVSTFPTLNPEDIAETIKFILSTPPHVQVHDLILKPVGEPF